VILESPYRGATPEAVAHNLAYARSALADSIRRGENPYASHLLLTQALSDALPEERDLGIRLGFEWAAVADFVAFYVDLGWSEGMRLARAEHEAAGRLIHIRTGIEF
jgi:hypothetical protein